MPPKEGAAAKAKAKATPKKSTAAAPEAPATVTSNRGKEYDTTAAAARPRRSNANEIAASAPSKPEASAAAEPKKRGRRARTEEPTEKPPKKRGRKADPKLEEVDEEHEEEEVAEPPRKRGRPAAKKDEAPATKTTTTATKRGRPTKAEKQDAVNAGVEDGIEAPATATRKRGIPAKAARTIDEDIVVEQPVEPKKRGRPAKASAPEPAEDAEENETEEVAEPPKKRGRKIAPAAEPETAKAPAKRGRPAKAKSAPAVTEEEQAPPKRRGRPPKGGGTTKIDADDEAAAEQLEEELEDAVQKTKGRGPAKKGKAGAKSKKAPVEPDEEMDADDKVEDDLAEPETSGKQYWLMKAEQEDREEAARDGTVVNTKFTIDDLREKTKPELWDGVRNLAAAKNLKAMRKGDLAFFYASGGKKGRKPGITGIMEIVSEAELDVTAESESSLYYEDNEGKRKHWVVVGVEFRHKLETPVHLSDLQKFKGPGAVLSSMQLHTQARLSVSKVTPKEWQFITEKLIKNDYPGDDALTKGLTLTGKKDEDKVQEDANADGATAVDDNFANGADEIAEATTHAEEPAAAEDSAELPDDDAEPQLPDLPLPTIETDAPTSDTMLLSTTNATSRPASRPGSRAPSVKPAQRTSSRQPSRQPSCQPSRQSSVAPSTTGSTAAGKKTGKAASRARSRQPSAAPSEAANLNGASEINGAGGDKTVDSLRPGSAGGQSALSARPGSAGSRPSSRGRSKQGRAGSAQPVGLMAAVAEEKDDDAPDALPYTLTGADIASKTEVDAQTAERIAG